MCLRSLHRRAFHRLGIDKAIPIIVAAPGARSPVVIRTRVMRASSNTMPKKAPIGLAKPARNAKFRDISDSQQVLPLSEVAFESHALSVLKA